MFESDADREAILLGLGGSSVAGPRGQFTGVLDQDYAAIGDETTVDSAALRLTVRTSEAERAGVGHGAVLQIGEEMYTVRSVQPDGLGMSVLVLEA